MKVKVKWNKRLSKNEIMGKKFSPIVMKNVYNSYRRIIEPYVPMRTGTLSTNVEVTSTYLRYKSPYAMFMYNGLLMLGDESGKAFANEGERKHIVDTKLNYSKEQHPLASSEWDKIAMRNGGLQLLSREVVKLVNKQR